MFSGTVIIATVWIAVGITVAMVIGICVGMCIAIRCWKTSDKGNEIM